MGRSRGPGGIWAGHHPRDGRPHGLDIVQAIAGDGNWGIDGDATLGRQLGALDALLLIATQPAG